MSSSPARQQFLINRNIVHVALGADVNEKNVLGQTGLHFAVASGSMDIAEFLMQWNCDVNALDEKGRSEYHLVVMAVSSLFIISD